MQGLYVHVSGGGGPVEAFLQLWGRSANGWFGLIAWEARIHNRGTPERAILAGWFVAARLTRPHYVPAKKMPQVMLAANRLDWPAPNASMSVDYFLGICDGSGLSLPEGIEIDTGPAWRRR
jgi:hypothetical protein